MTPPQARASSTAWAMLWRWLSSADSNETITSACVPSRPAARWASAGSRMRRLAGHSLACTMWRTASYPAAQSANVTPAVARNTGRRCTRIHADGDDAEDALAADHHPVGRRPGTRAGQPARLPPALRRQHPHRLDEVVDVGVVGGVVAAGAGGDPAAERREPERLREVAQREAVWAQLVLEMRPEHPGLDVGRPRQLVDLEHLVEAVEGDGDDAVGLRRVHAPHDRRAAAVGHDDVAGRHAPVERGLQLRLGAGMGDHVGRVGEVEVEGACAVGEVGAVGVEGALPGVGRAPRRHRSGHSDPRARAARRRPASGTGRGVIGGARPLGQRAGQFGALSLASVPRTPGTRPRRIGVESRSRPASRAVP